ncbi:chloramphenicol phosphotransferase CPT family protein [Streptomyces mashuensis]|uniref:chloramphenicol phosphotransferase CPT family protein n=1 Tax=Streptomyces mashuensis TaxID=33904 RepID=UPI001E3201D0|nr:chloramphenicol phosphotransferase CPT family protein [Streptomyces mashuensis]
MTTQVIVLNGGSSAGKTSLARCLQEEVLPGPWLVLGVDTLIETMPAWMASADPEQQPGGGLVLGSDGEVTVGPAFRALETAWYEGVAAMARAGARIVLDEVLLDGGDGQERLLKALGGLDVLWVGVRCDGEVAAAREAARGDRVPGMALRQAGAVHRGMRYDVEVDTTYAEPLACARAVAASIG